jgi:hypothetical protein
MEESKPDAWRANLIAGIGLLVIWVLFIAGTIWVYDYLARIEARNGVFFGNMIVVWLYELGGKNLVAIAMGLVSCFFLFSGVLAIRDSWRQRKKSQQTKGGN